MVKMNGVDLGQFQFDYDLTWAALLLHADGTVLARYGSRDDKGPMALNSETGLRKTLERVLEAHAAYPKNRALFVEKRGPKPKFTRPADMDSKHTRREPGPFDKKKCVHCHNIHDAQHDLLIQSGKYTPDVVWRYPLPRNIGLHIARDDGRRIERVLDGSAAQRAGLQPGDVLESLNGQAILSIADIQFVLHFLPADGAKLRAEVRRGDQLVDASLELAKPWRVSAAGWRASIYGLPPRPGLWVQRLSEDDLEKHDLSADRTALLVRGLFRSAVRKSGLKVGDIIVEYDGKSEALTAGAFHLHIRRTHHEPDSVLKLGVLRKGKRREIQVEF